ncbi:MAG TPA: HDIG domain-containing protein [Limnochordia bacterium]|nr:HDIG domain-containing protein [Limnochordia bacterium]
MSDSIGTLPLDREAAWALLCEWTKSESLRGHALGVEAAMRAYAQTLGGDPELWGITGLLHDMDYERYPDPADHPGRGVAVLRELGCPEEMCEAILGHAEYTGVPRRTPMAKALFAVDEVVGLVTAVALVRPSKQLADVKVSSVTKKFKDRAFARGCDRDLIQQGCDELGVELNEHIGRVLEAMKPIAPQLGL